MLDDVPAWPPGASRSTTIVRSPSDAPYTAAASPAGPPPTITVSYSAASGSVPRPSSSAELWSHDRLPVDDANDRPIAVVRQRTAPVLGGIGGAGLEPPERDLVAVEEAPQLGAGGVPPMPHHDRTRRARIRGDALQRADS